jgi:ankyrin repeat domain-containing protein 50
MNSNLEYSTGVLERKGEDGCTAFVLAAMNGHIEVLKYLLSKGANAEAADNEGNNSLHWSSFRGHVEVMRFLLRDAKIPFDCRNKKGETPVLFVATNHWSKGDIVTILLENGADPMAVDKIGNTALHKAALKGNRELIMLFKGKVPVDSKNERFETPFMLACVYDESLKIKGTVKSMLLNNDK